MCWEHPIAFTVFIQCFLDPSPPPGRNDWTKSSSVSVLPSWSFLTGCKVLNFHRSPLSAHSLSFTDSCTSKMLSTRVPFLVFLSRDAGRLINSMRQNCTVIYHLCWPRYSLVLKCKLHKGLCSVSSDHRLRHWQIGTGLLISKSLLFPQI